MKFSTREDIEAPIEAVFASITDFDGFERQALRRGAEVTRRDTLSVPNVGAEWQMRFTFRGKERDVNAKLTEFSPPNGFQAKTKSPSLDGVFMVELVALSPRRTRLQVSVDVAPTTLTGRLLVQSLKFAKTNVNKRFAKRVWQFAQDIESKHKP
jgi:uncharacterized protein YndB with AHSA1/START domain